LARSRRFRGDGGAGAPGFPGGAVLAAYPGVVGAAGAAGGGAPPPATAPRSVYNPTGAASVVQPTPFRLVPVQAAPSSYVPEPAEAAAAPEVVVSPSDVARNGYARVPADAELATLR